jgi:type IV pilus assembly protein PilA
MLTAVKQRFDREEEGFTLIELMVVLLIIAILLAIAIPTFLGARNTANARSTQENLRNALTAEQTNWTNNQAFATSLTSIEPSLNWTTATTTTQGGNTVTVTVLDNGQQVVLQGLAKDGNCYSILQSNDPTVATGSFTGYAETTGAGAACPAAAASYTAAPTAGWNTSAAGAMTFYTTAW